MTLFLQSAATRKVHTVVGLLSCPSLFGESDTIDPLARAAAEEAENERKVRCG